MFTSKLARPLRLCAPLAALALLALPAASQGDANHPCDGTGACTFTFDSGPQPANDQVEIPCLTPEEGAASGTGRETGGGNYDPDGAFFHLHASYQETGRIDFPGSGVYVLYNLGAHATVELGERRTTITVTDRANRRGTVYRSDGRPTGQVVTEHVLVHFTFIDSGDAGIPGDSDPTDNFIADVERGRWTCS